MRTVLVEGIPNKLRSTATLATYFETLYPNAIVSVRLGQDLRYLDRLVDQRLVAVTELERSMYANYLGYKRPTVRVGKMSQKIDATRHYSNILSDLNSAILKEQEAAKIRANFSDKMSGIDSLSIIESFLQVTEIGSLKKLLKKQSGSSTKWLRQHSNYLSTKEENNIDRLKNQNELDESLKDRNNAKEDFDSYQSKLGKECDSYS